MISSSVDVPDRLGLHNLIERHGGTMTELRQDVRNPFIPSR
jgi:hypothetical protein